MCAVDEERISSKTDYEFYKSLHICAKCHHEKAAPGRTLCLLCLDKKAEQTRQRRKQLDQDSLHQEWRTQSALKYRVHKDAGLCVRCKKKATHGVLCTEHWLKQKRYDHEKNRKMNANKPLHEPVWAYRKRNNLCLWCAEPLSNTSQYYCPTCLSKVRLCAEKAREKSPWMKEAIIRKSRQEE